MGSADGACVRMLMNHVREGILEEVTPEQRLGRPGNEAEQGRCSGQ